MLKHLRSKALMTFSLIVVFLFPMSGTVFGAELTPSPHFDYVALGDSYAAGQNPYGVEKSYGYTNRINTLLAQNGAAGNYKNFGVSGLTSEELLAEITLGSDTYNPKMVKCLTDAEIVTLDIGGAEMLDVLETLYKTNPALLHDPGTLSALAAQETAIMGNIYQTIYTIKTLNPDVNIYAMGYFNAFLSNPLYLLLPSSEQAYFEEVLLGGFNAQIATIVTNPGAFGLYSYPGSPAPEYISTIGVVTADELPGDIHPNKAGYKAIANAFWDVIEQDLPQ